MSAAIDVLNVLALLTLINIVSARVTVVNNEVFGVAEVRESRTRSLNADPGNIHVQIDAFGETHKLDLIPSNVFSSEFEAYISDMDDTGHNVVQKIVISRSVPDNIHAKHYTDSTGSASLHVEKRNGQLILEGILNHDIRIECRNNREENSLTNDPITHFVFKRTSSPPGTCHTVTPNISAPATDEKRLETRALPALIQPEVLLVIDYDISNFFKFNLDAIKKYIGVYFNSVNRRYSTITSPKIQNVITGIVLTNSSSAQNYVVYGSKPIVNAGTTLSEFGKWVFNKKASITANFDIAVLMTALDYGLLINGKWNSANNGVAYVGGACQVSQSKNLNVAIGEDTPGSYNGIHTHAHEIAHLYGSAHDGDKVDSPKGNPGALNCPASDGYIMSYEFGSKNKFYFSSCSINQMQFTMSSTSASCLLSSPKTNVVTFNSTLPGTIKSLDEQCAEELGSQYKFFEDRLSEVCVRMWCAPPAGSGLTVVLTTQGPALEGSRCATGKICINGECNAK